MYLLLVPQVRKHCRQRHLEWLRQIDRYSAHERGTPKPALYCVWGDDDVEGNF